MFIVNRIDRIVMSIVNKIDRISLIVSQSPIPKTFHKHMDYL